MDRILVAGGIPYLVRFGQNAVFFLEQRLEEQEFAAMHRTQRPRLTAHDINPALGQTPLQGLELLKSLPTAQSMHMMLWAALDGGRLKQKVRIEPFTFHEVGDIIDQVDDPDLVTMMVMNAWADAYPNKLPAEWEKLMRMAEEAVAAKSNGNGNNSKNGQREGLPTGKIPSSKPPKSESVRKPSGS